MFYDVFSELAYENKETPTGAAAKMGISAATVSNWKKGGIPQEHTLKKIAAYFNVSVGQLKGSDTPEPQGQSPGVEYVPTGPVAAAEGKWTDLTESELEMLRKFRDLTPEERQAIMTLLKGK